ncbi:uncharacterized protein B0T23DRAFT_398040 [Neurospora hispaniola]|uniref:Uncharacterized protein n=1 Tax=Neurospora hispaniola TaxID=588809 RepID=A0AAJ0I4T6_9PEZI|nr:hypothetical protein B0T23DRAFT_398040 [Neurospora hispaniola]
MFGTRSRPGAATTGGISHRRAHTPLLFAERWSNISEMLTSSKHYRANHTLPGFYGPYGSMVRMVITASSPRAGMVVQFTCGLPACLHNESAQVVGYQVVIAILKVFLEGVLLCVDFIHPGDKVPSKIPTMVPVTGAVMLLLMIFSTVTTHDKTVGARLSQSSRQQTQYLAIEAANRLAAANSVDVYRNATDFLSKYVTDQNEAIGQSKDFVLEYTRDVNAESDVDGGVGT